MKKTGRPRIVTDTAIVDAGERITLPKVTVRAIARELGVSEMSIYRHTGGIDALQLLVADGIVARTDFTVPDLADPEDAIVEFAKRMREFVLKHPGIAAHLAGINAKTRGTLSRVEQTQKDFAARYGFSAVHASILVSTVAEHAVALAALNLRAHREVPSSNGFDESTPTVRAGLVAVARLQPDERYSWSIRAVFRGTMGLLGLPCRVDTPIS